ncbi:MAG: glycosyltransferase [Lachnospiraceae bacterium]|nr:glycosyltransferase [Lachnospiraceae bacterium]
MKKVTTITPCHNSTKYLLRAWESLKNQTIGLGEMEVIFVDDCSDDDGATWEMLLGFEKEAPESVMVIHLEENLRQGGARNVALTYATGEYVQFLDSDDYLVNNALQELYEIAKEKNTDILQYDYVHPEGKDKADIYCRENIDYVLSSELARKGMLKQNTISVNHATKFYRREFLQESGVKFAEHVIYEEPLFVYPLLYFAKRISVVTNQYYYYQKNDDSTMETVAGERIFDHVEVQNKVYEFLKSYPSIYQSYQKEIDAYYYSTAIMETVINIARGARLDNILMEELVKISQDFSYTIEDLAYFGMERAYVIYGVNRMKSGFTSLGEFCQFAKKVDAMLQKKEIAVDIVIAVASKGGMENVLNLVCSYLLKEGIKLRVIQILDSHTKWLEENVEWICLSDRSHMTYLSEMENVYEAFAKDKGVGDIILCTGWPMITSVVGKTVEKLGLHSYIASYLHGSIRHYSLDGVGGIDELKYARGHFCINKNNGAKIKEEYPDAKIYEIGNPIPEERPKFSANRNPMKLIYIGRLSEEKNPALVIRGMAQAPEEFYLKVFGDGPMKRELEQLCKELKVEERVEFMDWVDNPWEYVKQDGWLLLSSHFEGFPLSVAEALLSGMPVISTPVQGVVDMITPGVNGYLFGDDKVEELGQILTMIKEDTLPIPDSDTCFLSAEKYLSENVLLKIKNGLMDMYLQ